MTALTSSTSTDPHEALVERLFERMLLDYGRKFTDQWLDADSDKLISHWANELRGFTAQEIARGMQSLEARDWPPTLPEFKRMCRPAVDSTVAYYEAVAGVNERLGGKQGSWSHPAIYWAAMPLAHELSTQGYSQVRVRWEQAFADQLNRGEWDQIPQPTLVLTHSTSMPTMTREQAEANLRKINAMVRPTAAGKVDHLAWAKRILIRMKRGDKSVSLIQKKFAEEAMGNLAADQDA